MEEDSTKGLSNVIRIDNQRIQGHLKHVVRGPVEETLNALLKAEAEGAQSELRAALESADRFSATRASTVASGLKSPRPDLRFESGRETTDVGRTLARVSRQRHCRNRQG